MKTKISTSIRITTEAARLLAELAEELGISRSAVMELAIRGMASEVRAKGNCDTLAELIRKTQRATGLNTIAETQAVADETQAAMVRILKRRKN